MTHSSFLDRSRRIAATVGTVAISVALVGGCTSTNPAPAEPDSTTTSVAAPAAPPTGVKPTVVLVHGAWADASSWAGEVAALQRQGYDVRAIANPLENLTTDSEYVANFLKTISGPIVLVGHSYGGSVITNAAAGNPNVKALVYVDAAAPAVGETNGSLSGSDSVLKQRPKTELSTRFRNRAPPPESSTCTSRRTCSSTTSATTCPPTRPPG